MQDVPVINSKSLYQSNDPEDVQSEHTESFEGKQAGDKMGRRLEQDSLLKFKKVLRLESLDHFQSRDREQPLLCFQEQGSRNLVFYFIPQLSNLWIDMVFRKEIAHLGRDSST